MPMIYSFDSERMWCALAYTSIGQTSEHQVIANCCFHDLKHEGSLSSAFLKLIRYTYLHEGHQTEIDDSESLENTWPLCVCYD